MPPESIQSGRLRSVMVGSVKIHRRHCTKLLPFSKDISTKPSSRAIGIVKDDDSPKVVTATKDASLLAAGRRRLTRFIATAHRQTAPLARKILPSTGSSDSQDFP